MNHQNSPRHDEVDDLLTVLTDEHCRATLSHFEETAAATATVGDLADEISTQLGSDPERVAIRLHHATLPRLDDAGIVDYGPRSNTARYRGHSELESLMKKIGELRPLDLPPD